MKSKHFLLSRFNTPYPPDPNYPESLYENSRKRALDPVWLDHRIELFERWCLPSVIAQTVRNFKWLILCNKATPYPHREYLDCYNDYDFINIVWTDKADRFTAPGAIRERLDGNEDYIINTQLDNDDAISIDFMEGIQKEATGKVEFLNYPRGYALHEGKVYGRRSEGSPFRSFVEKPDNIRTVYHVVHGASHTIAPVRQIRENEGMWLQVIHDQNLINKLARKSKDKGRPFDEIRDKFSILAL